MPTNVGNCSCHLTLVSVGSVPVIEIKAELKHSHCPLHHGMYGMVCNLLIFDNLHKASQCSGPQLKGTFSLDSSLMGSDSSESLAENFDK